MIKQIMKTERKMVAVTKMEFYDFPLLVIFSLFLPHLYMIPGGSKMEDWKRKLIPAPLNPVEVKVEDGEGERWRKI
jgi:hypothetical protein